MAMFILLNHRLPFPVSMVEILKPGTDISIRPAVIN